MPTSEALLPIDVPQSSAGAPLPHVFADEGRLLIAYIAQRPDPEFDGTNPRSISSATESQSIAILTADPYLAIRPAERRSHQRASSLWARFAALFRV